MSPESAATVARIRERLTQLREAVRESRSQKNSASQERDEAMRDRWSLQREIAAGKRTAESYEAMQETLDAAKQREETLHNGLREVLRDLTALSRYLQP